MMRRVIEDNPQPPDSPVDQDQENITTSKEIINGQDWDVEASNATDQETLNQYIDNKLDSLEIPAEITGILQGNFEPAVLGTKENPSGEDGSYSYEISLKSGDVTDSSLIEGVILTVAYEQDPNETKIDNSLQVIRTHNWQTNYENAGTKEEFDTWFTSELNSLNLEAQATADLENATYSAPIEGSIDYQYGVWGNFYVDVTVTSGDKTGTQNVYGSITPKPYEWPDQTTHIGLYEKVDWINGLNPESTDSYDIAPGKFLYIENFSQGDWAGSPQTRAIYGKAGTESIWPEISSWSNITLNLSPIDFNEFYEDVTKETNGKVGNGYGYAHVWLYGGNLTSAEFGDTDVTSDIGNIDYLLCARTEVSSSDELYRDLSQLEEGARVTLFTSDYKCFPVEVEKVDDKFNIKFYVMDPSTKGFFITNLNFDSTDE